MQKSFDANHYRAQINQFFAERANAAEGQWNFWRKDDGSLHAEFQAGQGADFIVRNVNGNYFFEFEREVCPACGARFATLAEARANLGNSDNSGVGDMSRDTAEELAEELTRQGYTCEIETDTALDDYENLTCNNNEHAFLRRSKS